MIQKQRYRPSANGEGDVFTREWLPDSPPIGLVQIAHGMAEHSSRYAQFAAALVAQGYAVFANDHIGHGKSAMGHRGTFSLQGEGFAYVRADVHSLFVEMRERYPNTQTILFGHSMGSIASALYASEHPEQIDRLILCGTPAANPMGGLGILLGGTKARLFGNTSSALLLSKLNTNMFMKGYKERKTLHDWLSREEEQVQQYVLDPDCGFPFSSSAYEQMLKGLRQWNKPNWAGKIKPMPILIVAGADDNAGKKGKGPTRYYERLKAAGQKDVTLKLYEGARHELLNERNRTEVTEDILSWLLLRKA